MTPFGLQEVHGRDDLLVGRRAGVVDVLRRLEALVLHRVEQQAVGAFDDRQHRLAGGRGPAAEDRCDLVLGEQLVDLLGEDGRLALAVLLDELDLLAEDAAVGVDLLGGEDERVANRLLADGHRTRRGVQEAELDGVAVDAGVTGCCFRASGRRRIVGRFAAFRRIARVAAAGGRHQGDRREQRHGTS